MDNNFKRLRRKLESKLSQIEKDITLIRTAQNNLFTTTEEIVKDIEEQSERLKACIDEVVKGVKEAVDTITEENGKILHKIHKELEAKVSTCRENIQQCDAAGKPRGDLNAGTSLVSPSKVNKMVYDSIDQSTYVQPVIKLTQCTFITDPTLGVKDHIRKLVGKIETSRERLIGNEQKDITSYTTKLKLLTTLDTPDSDGDVNALDASVEDASTLFACFNTGRDIMRIDVKNAKRDNIAVGVKVDDMTIGPDGELYFTSPDGQWIKRLHVNEKGTKPANFYTGNGYIHGLTVSNDRQSVVACVTDTPNYSDMKPLATVIIIVAMDTGTVKQIPLRGYTGKVYRIAQNTNGQYVMTFPKEGRVLSVNEKGHVVSSFTCEGSSSCSYASRDTPADAASKRSVTDSYSGTFWPSGVGCDVNGCIYVSDWLGRRVLVLNERCKFLGHVTSEYKSPNSLAVSGDRDIIIIGDRGRIQVWTLCA